MKWNTSDCGRAKKPADRDQGSVRRWVQCRGSRVKRLEASVLASPKTSCLTAHGVAPQVSVRRRVPRSPSATTKSRSSDPARARARQAAPRCNACATDTTQGEDEDERSIADRDRCVVAPGTT